MTRIQISAPTERRQEPEVADPTVPIKLSTGAPSASPGLRFEDRVAEHFTTWDQNNDGTLSRVEVDRAMQDPNFQGDAGAALATLKTHLGALEQLANDEYGEENGGLSVADLEVYRALHSAGVEVNHIGATDEVHRGRILTASHRLFATDSVDPDALEQGSRGDCWLLASAVAEAHRDPEDFRSRFRTLPDGNYSVRFEGQEPVLVEKPTDAEIAYGARSGADGTWATVLEKAAGQLEWQDHYFGAPTHPADEVDGGRTNAEGIAHFTGAPTDFVWLANAKPAAIRDQLEKGLSDEKLVVGSSSPGATAIPGDHAYTILGYDRASDTVTLRNPWGHGELTDPSGAPIDGNDDGIFAMSLSQFTANFDGFTIER